MSWLSEASISRGEAETFGNFWQAPSSCLQAFCSICILPMFQYLCWGRVLSKHRRLVVVAPSCISYSFWSVSFLASSASQRLETRPSASVRADQIDEDLMENRTAMVGHETFPALVGAEGGTCKSIHTKVTILMPLSVGDQRSRTCSSLPKRATYPCGRAGRGSATLVRPGLSPGQSTTCPTRSMHRRTAMC